MYADKPAKQRYEKVYFPPIKSDGLFSFRNAGLTNWRYFAETPEAGEPAPGRSETGK